MKKNVTLALALSGVMAYAQTTDPYEGRVGINTETPSAVLNVKSEDDAKSSKNFELENQSGAKLMTVLNNGHIGLGTDTPGIQFHFVNNLGHFMRLQFKGKNDMWTDFGKRETGEFFITNFADNDWRPAIGVNNRGFVSIGAENATERLDVQTGNVKVRDLPNTAGSSTDKIVVVDSNGVLKSIDSNAISSTGGNSDVKATSSEDTCTAANAGVFHYKERAVNGQQVGTMGFCTRQNGTYTWVYFSNGANILQAAGSNKFGEGL